MKDQQRAAREYLRKLGRLIPADRPARIGAMLPHKYEAWGTSEPSSSGKSTIIQLADLSRVSRAALEKCVLEDTLLHEYAHARRAAALGVALTADHDAHFWLELGRLYCAINGERE